MSYGRSTCAMCGEQLAEAYSGYRLPPVCVRLMDGADDVDPTGIAATRPAVASASISTRFSDSAASILHTEGIARRGGGGS